MAYKGEDLDLRTPQLWSPATGAVSREAPEGSTRGLPRSVNSTGERADPIWVDETVMACCNQAYDLAVAHRAAEVRLEHLLNAMTLVEAAVRVLEQRGILVTALRRDVGAMIATELPVGSSGGTEAAQRSPELEQALRLAAERAYPRRTPVTTDELLRALFDMNRELPAIQLLHHHSADWSPRDVLDAPPGEPQGPRTRMRVAAGSQYTGEAPTEVEVVRADPNRPRGWPDDRLTTLERSIDMWLGELTRSGSVLADRVRSLEHAVNASRSESQNIPAAISEQLESLQSRQRKFDEVERTLAHLLDRVTAFERLFKRRAAPEAVDLAPIVERLAALERVLASPPAPQVDFGPVEARLQDIAAHAEETGRAVAAVADRVKGVDDALGKQLPPAYATLRSEIKALAGEVSTLQSQGEGLQGHFTERLQALRTAIEGQSDAIAAKVAVPVVERLAGLDSALGSEIRALAGEVSAIQLQGESPPGLFTERLQALAAAIEGQGDGIAAKVAAPVLERLAGLDSAVGSEIKALAGEVSALQSQGESPPGLFTERLQALTAAIEGQGDAIAAKVAAPVMNRLEGLDSAVGSEIKALAEEIRAQRSQGQQVLGQIAERLQALGAGIEGQTEEIAAKVVAPNVERLAILGASFEQRQAEVARALSQLAERLGAIDKGLVTRGQQMSELQAAHTRDITDLRGVLLTINSNERTIAMAMDKWLFDTTGDLSVITNRLEALERAHARPLELIESLSSAVHDLQRLVEDREEHSGLRRWLLGNDDGHAPSREARAGAETMPKPPLGAGGSEPRPAGHRSWLQQATDFVRRRRSK